LSNGNIVTCWSDIDVPGGDKTEVRAQIYTPAGAKVGAEFTVNTMITDRQQEPGATPLSNGGFVVVWQDSFSLSQGGPTTPGFFVPADDSGGVRAQVYDANGTAVGSEIRVNTTLPGMQYSATVSGLFNGNFVVTWADTGGTLGDSSDEAIKAQIFTAAGVKVGSEFLVNTNTSNIQNRPAITGLAGGGFVITWHDFSGSLGDNSRASVKAQIYDASGAKVGGEFLVNTATNDLQWFTTIAPLSGGGFVITWEDESLTGGDASGTAVKAQIFAANGAKVGSEFLVNTNTASGQFMPAVAPLKNDGFVVTWQDNSKTGGDTAVSIIKAQVFNGSGAKAGGEFLVNQPSADSKVIPLIGTLSSGGFVIMWKEINGIILDPASSEKTKVRVYTPQ
jgi:hypothetical protein